jgi:hypothetical protein
LNQKDFVGAFPFDFPEFKEADCALSVSIYQKDILMHLTSTDTTAFLLAALLAVLIVFGTILLTLSRRTLSSAAQSESE